MFEKDLIIREAVLFDFAPVIQIVSVAFKKGTFEELAEAILRYISKFSGHSYRVVVVHHFYHAYSLKERNHADHTCGPSLPFDGSTSASTGATGKKLWVLEHGQLPFVPLEIVPAHTRNSLRLCPNFGHFTQHVFIVRVQMF